MHQESEQKLEQIVKIVILFESKLSVMVDNKGANMVIPIKSTIQLIRIKRVSNKILLFKEFFQEDSEKKILKF